ncbi:MAG: peptide deformylase, partial [Maritimibacter harenae]
MGVTVSAGVSTGISSTSSDERSVYEEGCLSIPDQYADVERPKMVEVEWLDRDGKLQKEEFDGLWA